MASNSQDKRQKSLEEPKKLETIGDESHVTLKVNGQDGDELTFRMKRTFKLKKVMDAYRQRHSEYANAIVFLYAGRRLHGQETPESLEMESEDEIDAMLHQTGGRLINYA